MASFWSSAVIAATKTSRCFFNASSRPGARFASSAVNRANRGDQAVFDGCVPPENLPPVVACESGEAARMLAAVPTSPAWRLPRVRPVAEAQPS